MPSLFVSHGLPPVALQETEYSMALQLLGKSLGSSLKGIVVVSNQWVIPGSIQITSMEKAKIQHNFYGYQKDLYDLTYDPPMDQSLVDEVALILEDDFEISLNNEYGFDHGVWMPLRHLRPQADVPVVQLSLPLFSAPRNILNLGHKLASLREKGILLLGSGQSALNLERIIWYARHEDVNPKIKEFVEWLKQQLGKAHIEELINFKTEAPFAEFAQSNNADLYPLFFAIGASLPQDKLEIIYDGYVYSTVSLLSLGLMPGKARTLSLSLSLQ